MKKSELVQEILYEFSLKGVDKDQLSREHVESAIDLIIDSIKETLLDRRRVEIRGFGVFEVQTRKEREVVNPKTFKKIFLQQRVSPHFKAGKLLNAKINCQSTE